MSPTSNCHPSHLEVLKEVVAHVARYGKIAQHKHRGPNAHCADCALLNKLDCVIGKATAFSQVSKEPPAKKPLLRVTEPEQIVRFWSREKRARHARKVGAEVASLLYREHKTLPVEELTALICKEAAAEVRRHKLERYKLESFAVEGANVRLQDLLKVKDEPIVLAEPEKKESLAAKLKFVETLISEISQQISDSPWCNP